MAGKQATVAEFTLSEQHLEHRPTGACFIMNSANDIIMVLPGLLGIRLQDRQDYNVISVMDVAWTLARQSGRTN